jgi:capsular exopolysaccharide synthesis family protein
VISINQALIDARKERVSLSATLIAIRDAIRNGGDLRQHLVTVEPIVGRELMLNALGLNPQATEVIASLERKLLEDRAKLDTLLAHFGPVHPRVTEITRTIQNTEQYVADFQGKVNQRLAGIRQDDLAPMLTAMVEEKLAQLWAHEKELTEQYERSETEAVQLNDRRAELTLVELDVQRLRKLYDSLLERMSNIDIKQNSSDVRVAVVSEPTATKWPVSPRLKIVIGLCLMAGLGGGAVVVYIIDVLDDRFRSPEELSEQIGTPVLAVVRKLAESDATGAEALQVHVAAEAVESEAFRTLRTTLAFSGQDLQRLAITSAEPGDGKTTIISNLGVSYAQAGRKTLLIDADMRRPGLTKLFDMRKLGGLSEVLRSEEEIAQFCQDHVQTTGVPGLFLLPCGSKRSDPGELLSHPRLEDLIAWAESTYDQVLIDCPPILAASDAAIVGRLTDGVVLVVQPQKNHRRLVIRAAEELNSLRVKLVGIVANKVGEDKEGYYGYGHGYGYGYGYGYGNGYGNGGEDEADEELASQHDESRERERPSAPASTATDDPAAEPAEIDENSSAVPLPDIVQMPSAGSGGPRRVIAPRRAA